MRPHVLPLLTVAALAVAPAEARAGERALTVQDYRTFRAMSLDLQGRVPTLDEVEARGRADFDEGAFVDRLIASGAYAPGLRQVYMDRLRLDLSSGFPYVPSATTLRRYEVLDASGKTVRVYFRAGQRRTRTETDGAFCLTETETGLRFPSNQAPVGTARPVSQAALDAATVLVKPWWLYRDYATANPTLRFGASWPTSTRNFAPAAALLKEDGTTDTTAVRVCREEAQPAATGAVYLTGRTAPPAGTAPPYGRYTQLPLDSAYAKAHANDLLDCSLGLALPNSAACGCGVGLERCVPGTGPTNDPASFVVPTNAVLGADEPLGTATATRSAWARYWWGEEAVQFLERTFEEDRDVRSLLTGKGTWVNGPLRAFYKHGAAASWGNGREQAFNYAVPTPVIDPASLPSLLPHDTDSWQPVTNRGPHAAGLLTTPIFLTKYATRRARAHAVYQAFLCKDFIAGNTPIGASEDPDLAKRPGCATCHATLEPMAAFFARTVESTWTWLPQANFPTDAALCRKASNGAVNANCPTFYDSAFATSQASYLKGSYNAPQNADRGPAGLASDVVSSPEFARCVVRTVGEALMPGQLGDADAALEANLARVFVANGFRIRPLLRAIVTSEAYRTSNNLTSSAWRATEAP
jgi:hypothetical protein